MGRTNIIFERARFNKRAQDKKESDWFFFLNLYELAKNCQFCSLTEELIHDSIVGIRLDSFSQKLMQADRFKLDKAITETKLSELVKEHHEILKANENGKLEGKINRVNSKEKLPPETQKHERKRAVKGTKTSQKISRQNMLSLW